MNTNRSASTRHVGGFSLMELLVAVAIVGILMAIAIPGYREHVRRGAVEEAQAELRRGRVAIEQYFLDNRTYVGAPLPASTSRFSMRFADGEPTETTYKLEAIGSGNVSGFIYTLNERGVSTTDGGDWGTSTTCWIIRKGGSCGG